MGWGAPSAEEFEAPLLRQTAHSQLVSDSAQSSLDVWRVRTVKFGDVGVQCALPEPPSQLCVLVAKPLARNTLQAGPLHPNRVHCAVVPLVLGNFVIVLECYAAEANKSSGEASGVSDANNTTSFGDLVSPWTCSIRTLQPAVQELALHTVNGLHFCKNICKSLSYSQRSFLVIVGRFAP
jgi:hypothetical protein